MVSLAQLLQHSIFHMMVLSTVQSDCSWHLACLTPQYSDAGTGRGEGKSASGKADAEHTTHCEIAGYP